MFATAPREVSSTIPRQQAKCSKPASGHRLSAVNNPNKSSAGSATRTKHTAAAAEPPGPVKASSSKISTRGVPKAILDLGTTGNYKTALSAAYAKGGFPCRIDHGSVRHKISWTQPVETLEYNPLLVTLMEGLRETKHPFVALVPAAIVEMLSAGNARAKVLPILPALIPPLRAAIADRRAAATALPAALAVLSRLAAVCHSALLPHLPALLPPLASHVHSATRGNTAPRDAVAECLRAVETAIARGGPAGSDGSSDGNAPPRTVDVVLPAVSPRAPGAGPTGAKVTVAVGEWVGVGGGDRGVGGADGARALKMIKDKIPTYSSAFG
ncbi:hypothetical protein HDU83_002890 [Entophlyctis luteolus]|nr:hypothetical protein HDU83_002890 [Entophlyctis luteolus]